MTPVDYTDFIGMTLKEVAAEMGTTTLKARLRLESYGLRSDDAGRYRVPRTAVDAEAAIASRLANIAPSVPCFRCGCRRCACRDRVAA